MEKRISLTEFPKITVLCEKHFEESCFNKSVDLGRTIMNSYIKIKLCLILFLIFNI